jgi:hypothetical protein
VPVAVQPILARQEPVQGIHHIVVRARSHLHHDQPSGRVRDEYRQQPILRADVGEERGTSRRQICDPARRPRSDREKAGLYGKMLRSASRMRPRPPIAGADS